MRCVGLRPKVYSGSQNANRPLTGRCERRSLLASSCLTSGYLVERLAYSLRSVTHAWIRASVASVTRGGGSVNGRAYDATTANGGDEGSGRTTPSASCQPQTTGVNDG